MFYYWLAISTNIQNISYLYNKHLVNYLISDITDFFYDNIEKKMVFTKQRIECCL